jgi:hypothetical protein
MLDERIFELIQRDIDRANDDSERLELEERLERDPGARAYFDELLRVSELLGRAPQNEPPADFSAGVMTAVRTESAGRKAEVIRPLFERRRQMALRFGGAMAAAAALAFILTPSLSRSLDPSGLRGSMVKPVARVEQSWTIAAPQSTIRVTAARDVVTLEFAGEAASAGSDAEVAFDAQALRPESLAGGVPPASEAGIVRVRFAGGNTVVRFHRTTSKATTLPIRLRHGGNAEFQTRVDIPAFTNF